MVPTVLEELSKLAAQRLGARFRVWRNDDSGPADIGQMAGVIAQAFRAGDAIVLEVYRQRGYDQGLKETKTKALEES